jgi:hypothetical protein
MKLRLFCFALFFFACTIQAEPYSTTGHPRGQSIFFVNGLYWRMMYAGSDIPLFII